MKIAGLISLVAYQIFSKSDEQNRQQPTIQISNIIQEEMTKNNNFLGNINFKYSYSTASDLNPFNVFNKNKDNPTYYSHNHKNNLLKEEIKRFKERATVIRDSSEQIRRSNKHYNFYPWLNVNKNYTKQLFYSEALLLCSNDERKDYSKKNRKILNQTINSNNQKVISDVDIPIEKLLKGSALETNIQKAQDYMEYEAFDELLSIYFYSDTPPFALIYIDLAPDTESVVQAQKDILNPKRKKNPLGRYMEMWGRQNQPLIHDYITLAFANSNLIKPSNLYFFLNDISRNDFLQYCKMKFIKREQQRRLFFNGVKGLLQKLLYKQATWHKASASHKTYLTDDLFITSKLNIKYTNNPTLVQNKENLKFSTNVRLSAKAFSFNDFDVYANLQVGVSHNMDKYCIKDPYVSLQCDFTKQFDRNNVINKFLNKFSVGYKFDRGSHGYIKYENVLECQLFDSFHIMFNYGEQYPLSTVKTIFANNSNYKADSMEFMLKNRKCGIHIEKRFDNIDCRIRLGVEFKEYEPKLNLWNNKYYESVDTRDVTNPGMSHHDLLKEIRLLETKDFFSANVMSCNFNIFLSI